MRTTRSSTKKAAKSKLSGFAVAGGGVQNKRIVFDADEDGVTENVPGVTESDLGPVGSLEQSAVAEKRSGDDEDDAVEEVKGSAARESTQKIREEERKIVKEATVKKKRSKKKEQTKAGSSADNSGIGDNEHEEVLTDDFFKMVDSERAAKLQLSKEARKQEKRQKELLGKHTTFVAEDEHNLIGAPKNFGQNIEVIALDNGHNDEDDQDEEDRRNLLSATLGSTSENSIVFARGNLTGGASMARSCESRKRGTNDDEAWERRKMRTYRSGHGRAAYLFAKK